MSSASERTKVKPICIEKKPQPFSLIIFGATGDLTRRKLIPAVFNLFRQDLLPEKFNIIAFARRDYDDETFRQYLYKGWQDLAHHDKDEQTDKIEAQWKQFISHVLYHRSTFQDAHGYQALAHRLKTLSGTDGPGNCLYYLATQPEHVEDVITHLGQNNLVAGKDDPYWTRVVAEKPFGYDLESAAELNDLFGRVFAEHQIYRIDHYLGKETVQNLLVFRFANSLFEPLWNSNYVDHVQITVSETIGVEGRGAFYEHTGAIKDILQNHMMHLLCLVAMEPPHSLKADAIREEKVQVLKSLQPLSEECVQNQVIRAQYTQGGEHGEMPGYRQEDGVADDSTTETFVALKVMVDNWRWAGVPFYLRTGKRMPSRITEIRIHFKAVPHVLFNANDEMVSNCLVIRIQPREGISLRFQAKRPGPSMVIEPCKMHFGYADAFGKNPPDAYERLILDAAVGDATLFTRSDEVEYAWRFLDPIIKGCSTQCCSEMVTYPAGSWGPVEADELIESAGRKWELTRMPKPTETNE